MKKGVPLSWEMPTCILLVAENFCITFLPPAIPPSANVDLPKRSDRIPESSIRDSNVEQEGLGECTNCHAMFLFAS